MDRKSGEERRISKGAQDGLAKGLMKMT